MTATSGAPVVDDCERCGRVPARAVTLRAPERRTWSGRLCRDCGLAAFRNMQSQTLWRGWHLSRAGPYFSWICLFGNMAEGARLHRLSAPQVHDRAILRPLSRPLDPGRPLWQRRRTRGCLAVVALFTTIVAAVMTIALVSVGLSEFHKRGLRPIDASNAASVSGQCVQITGATLDGLVDCAGPHSGVVTGTTTQLLGGCAHASDATFLVGGTTRQARVCVDRGNHSP